MQRRRSRRHGDGVARTGTFRHGLFEGGDARSLGQPVATQRLGDGGDIVVVDALAGVGNERFAHALSTVVSLGADWRLTR